MKRNTKITMIASLASALLTACTASATPRSGFNSVTCRSYDYYQAKGGRKVFEISLEEIPYQHGFFAIKVSRIHETLLANSTYQENSRTVEFKADGLTCVQPMASTDPKVITCATGLALITYDLPT